MRPIDWAAVILLSLAAAAWIAYLIADWWWRRQAKAIDAAMAGWTAELQQRRAVLLERLDDLSKGDDS